MRRVLPFVVAICLCACSKGTPAQAKDAAPQAPGTTTTAAATPAETIKPVPAQLPAVIAKVNGETISKSDFEEAVRNAEQRAGSPVPDDQRDRIYRGILDQMIGYKLLIQETKNRKVNVPDADIDARIANIRQQFPTEDAFKQALAQQHLSVDQMKTDARQDMAVSKLIEDEISPKIAVKPEDVQTFYQQNPQFFQQGEQVRASHILIGVPKDADAATRAKARAKAESVLKQVKAGKDFAALAKANSEDPGSAVQGGDLGFFAKGQMVPPFDAVAFTLKPGTVSDLVETDFGYHIIKVAEKKPGRTVPLDEAKQQIEQHLADQNRQKETEAFVNALKAKGKVEVFI